MPIFDDVEGEQQRAMDAALEKNKWYEDEASAIEDAYDEGISSAIMLMEMRTVFIGTGVAGLFHLFEKQLYRFLNQEIGPYGFTHRVKKQDVPFVVTKWEDADTVIKSFPHTLRLGGDGVTLKDAFTSSDLTELREVRERGETRTGSRHGCPLFDEYCGGRSHARKRRFYDGAVLQLWSGCRDSTSRRDPLPRCHHGILGCAG